MGQGGSQEEGSDPQAPSTCGYHVLKVNLPSRTVLKSPLQMHANSPAQKAGLITFFDFILSANGVAFVCLPSLVALTRHRRQNKFPSTKLSNKTSTRR
jgi:hypothetical protein